MVDNATLEMKVDYRASKPMKDEAGQFRALVNGRLIDSDPLPTKDGHGSRVISLPGFYGALFNNTNDALALAQTNDFTFEMHYERTYEGGSPENCKSIMVFPHQFEVEPTSTLEISGLYHYARMPNLKLFTQTGYPSRATPIWLKLQCSLRTMPNPSPSARCLMPSAACQPPPAPSATASR